MGEAGRTIARVRWAEKYPGLLRPGTRFSPPHHSYPSPSPMPHTLDRRGGIEEVEELLDQHDSLFSSPMPHAIYRREEPEEVEEIVDDHPSPSSMPHIPDRDDELEDSVEGGIDRGQIFASALEAHVPGLEFR